MEEWCRTVGPSVVVVPEVPPHTEAGRLVVVNWNMHVGHGDVETLVEQISADEQALGFSRPNFILLLEESFRRSSRIPDAGGLSVPGRIAPPESGMDIEEVARRLGWWMYYVPSMRNGREGGEQAEDRGNAILSTLPLEDFEAVELPFVVQRRVALIATATDVQGQPLLRVAVAHLDTRAPILKGWIFGGPAARRYQAEELVATIKDRYDDLPLVLGGDLNTLAGSGEAAVDAMSQVAKRKICGTKATHISGFVLDHLFTRVPDVWNSSDCVRLDSTFGSDHHPLVFGLNVPKETSLSEVNR
jgi:endonuclease/exonuclease/phosphatase family metal-dependent hydrolase